jgi:ribokinase
VDRLPVPGETVIGSSFQMIPGGKGANQAYAAGMLGGDRVVARMVGRVGTDLFADHLRASLSAAGVDVSAVWGNRTEPTGVALIWVEKSGQNSIVVASGANLALIPADVEAMRPALTGASFALFQLETPLETVRGALRVARESGARTILDPAPAQPLDEELLALVDILTPNESEASVLLGRPVERIGREDAPAVCAALRAKGARAVCLKLGDQGCYYDDGSRRAPMAAFVVEAKDSTAAGDTFNAGLAVALAEGLSITAALRLACAAAAISVTRPGAQASVPRRAEVEAFLAATAS